MHRYDQRSQFCKFFYLLIFFFTLAEIKSHLRKHFVKSIINLANFLHFYLILFMRSFFFFLNDYSYTNGKTHSIDWNDMRFFISSWKLASKICLNRAIMHFLKTSIDCTNLQLKSSFLNCTCLVSTAIQLRNFIVHLVVD